jgi:ATP-binding cassette subfamily B protein RaxB
MLVFSSSKRLPIVRQAEAAECGLACLAMVASFHGYRTDLNALRRRYPASQNGVTLRALMRLASHLQLAARPLRIEMHHLAELRLPAILHWDMTHFVVLKSVAGKGIVIHDPARGERLISLAEASKHFTGVALELSPTEGLCSPGRAPGAALLGFLERVEGKQSRLDPGAGTFGGAADPGFSGALLYADYR